jgi:signal transduction histidine kinase
MLTRRPWMLLDCLVALVFCAWLCTALAAGPDPTPVEFAAIGVVGLAMALRRRHPVPACVAVLAALVAVGWSDYRVCALATGYVLYTVATTARWWVVASALAVTVLAPYSGHLTGDHVVMAGMTMVAVCAAGVAMRQFRTYQRDRVRRGVAEERARIARELHDVVAHSMSVITVQAGFGHLVLDDSPDKARAALNAIETTGRETLSEMRRLLGVLRADGPAPSPEAGLAHLERLVARTSDAAVRVDLVITGRRRELSVGVDLSAYRIIQEALTNVVRHARADTCRVLVDYGERELCIEITDDGVGSVTSTEGHGMAGIRERVRLHGGTFDASPLPGRGFRVAARLPL